MYKQEADSIEQISIFVNRKIDNVRRKLSMTDSPNDEQAWEIIISELFQDGEGELFSVKELQMAAKKIFYKTRGRLGILQPLIEDKEVSEIMVNGPNTIFVERGGHVERYGFTFDSTEEVEEVMRNIAANVHREINEMNPIVDARLPDGSRVNGVYKNIALNGPILTIRKFSDRYMTMNHLMSNGTITKAGFFLLSSLVACGYNIFISGGTSSGKTTFLNALADYIPREERIIVIEDSGELKLNNAENIVHMECRNSNAMGKGRVDMAQLIKSSLRMRPDRIIVGEVRGGEVLDMLQAMNTGHQGSMSTGHGNSVEGMLQRLETMYLMAMPISIDAIRAQIAQGIDIMVHIEKSRDGRRRVTEIVEIAGYREGEYKLNPLMTLNNDSVLMPTKNTINNSGKVFLKGERYAGKLSDLGFIHKG